jgi:hypothetical protein
MNIPSQNRVLCNKKDFIGTPAKVRTTEPMHKLANRLRAPVELVSRDPSFMKPYRIIQISLRIDVTEPNPMVAIFCLTGSLHFTPNHRPPAVLIMLHKVPLWHDRAGQGVHRPGAAREKLAHISSSVCQCESFERQSMPTTMQIGITLA